MLLIRGGHVITMDATLGELADADVLVDGDRIVAVGPRLDAPDGVEVLDAAGCVVAPGLVDTHRHTWQTALRAVCADWTLGEYFRGVRQAFSPRYAAQDVYAGNLVGALEALDAGVTTIADFSHAINTPEHADAAVAGLQESGIRAVFAYGCFAPPSAAPGFADHGARLNDARRVAADISADGRVRMGLSLTEAGLVPWADTTAEVTLARELGGPCLTHTGCVWGSPVTMGVRELHHTGLLGPDQVHVHANCLDDQELGLLAQAGAWVSSSPETELSMGMGVPVIGRALELGMRPTLSADVVSLNAGDLFAQMRLGLHTERARRNAAFHAYGRMPESVTPTVRDALRWATVNGAAALGLEGVAGVLAPGVQADVIVVGGQRLGLHPMTNDPVGTLVLQAGAADVRDVLVAGRVVKRDGVLTGVDLARVRGLLDASRERVFAAVEPDGPILPPEPPGFQASLDAMAAQNLAQAWWPT